jgi:hypothetical protein
MGLSGNWPEEGIRGRGLGDSLVVRFEPEIVLIKINDQE